MGGGSDMQTIKRGGGGGVRKGKVPLPREARISGVPYVVAQTIYPY